MSDLNQIGLTGLAVMGANLARNIARNGYSIAVHNRTPTKTRDFVEEFGAEGAITGTETIEEFVAALERPRKIIIMVKAGGPVDAVIDELAPHLDAGDIVIDAGNSHFLDTKRRAEACAERGLRFVGIGVSGGEEGALNGPSIMPGGDRDAWAEVEEILTAIAVEVDGTPCCVYVGPDGAGHYVKMVHNGIEYGDMQLIAESYDLLRNGAGLSVPEIAATFEDWNQGDLESVPDRDHRDRAAPDRRGDRRPAGRRHPRPGRAEGHRPLDQPGRARARRAADRDHRGRLRPLAVGAARPARRRRRGARRPAARAKAPPTTRRSSTTCAPRCTPARSSRTRRASSRWRPRRASTAGTSTSARWRRSGAAAASSARASSTASARRTTPRTRSSTC